MSQNALCPDLLPNCMSGGLTTAIHTKNHPVANHMQGAAWRSPSALWVRTHSVAIAGVLSTAFRVLHASVCLSVCLSVQQRKYELHYHIAQMVNYLGHCVSMAALMAAFLLFLALR